MLGVLLLLGLVAGAGALDRLADAAQRLAQLPGVGVPARSSGRRTRSRPRRARPPTAAPAAPAAWPARPARRRSPRRRGPRRACISSVVVPNPSVMSDHPLVVLPCGAVRGHGARELRRRGAETARKRVRSRTPDQPRRTEPTTSAHAARTAAHPPGVCRQPTLNWASPSSTTNQSTAVRRRVELLVAHHLRGRRASRPGSRTARTRRPPPRRTRPAARRGPAAARRRSRSRAGCARPRSGRCPRGSPPGSAARAGAAAARRCAPSRPARRTGSRTARAPRPAAATAADGGKKRSAGARAATAASAAAASRTTQRRPAAVAAAAAGSATTGSAPRPPSRRPRIVPITGRRIRRGTGLGRGPPGPRRRSGRRRAAPRAPRRRPVAARHPHVGTAGRVHAARPAAAPGPRPPISSTGAGPHRRATGPSRSTGSPSGPASTVSSVRRADLAPVVRGRAARCRPRAAATAAPGAARTRTGSVRAAGQSADRGRAGEPVSPARSEAVPVDQRERSRPAAPRRAGRRRPVAVRQRTGPRRQRPAGSPRCRCARRRARPRHRDRRRPPACGTGTRTRPARPASSPATAATRAAGQHAGCTTTSSSRTGPNSSTSSRGRGRMLRRALGHQPRFGAGRTARGHPHGVRADLYRHPAG